MTQTPVRESTPGSAPKTALSRELSEFLVELSIGVHRFSMYPSNHPSLRPVVESVVVGLAGLVSAGGSLSIGVANRQLVIEGISTDRKHPVLSDLARKLHDQQIGALTLQHGLRATEIEGFLSLLAEAAGDEELEPIGLRDELPTWPHVTLHPLGFDRLGLREGEGAVSADQAGELWIGLARAVLAGRGASAGPDLENYDPKLLAGEINSKPREAAYDQVISGYLRQLAGQLKGARGQEAERVRQRVTTLVREMDDQTLARMVEMGGDLQARENFVLDSNQGLAVDAVVKVLRAAATASGQTISTSMTRILTKLSRHAGDGGGQVKAQANSALRENVEELLADWRLEDPNPDQYTRVLDSMAGASPIFDRGGGGMRAEIDDDAVGAREDELPGCMRILRMALEVDAWGETVRTAMLDAIAMGLTPELLELVEEAPEGNEAARRIRGHVTDPEQVRNLLAREQVDEDALRTVVQQMGPENAAIPLLDGMANSESRQVRRVVFDTLVSMGDVVGPIAAERLPDEDRWFVQRNLIALLAKLPTVPPNVEVMSFLSSREARIRREALPLAFRVPVARDRALGLGLADPDERVCRMALHELRGGIPQAILPTLLNRVVKGDRSHDIRAVAIRTLSGSRSKLVRDTLVEICTAGKTLLGKPKLVEANPAVAEALRLLHAEWSDDSEAAALAEAAGKSKEVLHRRAVGAA